MRQILRSNERGHANHGWLDSYHTFSFADYYNPHMMGFGPLRVINEDRIAGGGGFPLHPHRDMEIVTYMVSGALEHQDTLGNRAVIRPGEVQKMSAGTGIRHSEFNASKDETAHLLQIWIIPDQMGLTPGYEQKSFAEEMEKSSLVLVAAKDGRQGAVRLYQDADIWISKPSENEKVDFPISNGRAAWLQIIRGEIEIEGEKLLPGDAMAVVDESVLRWTGLKKENEVMIFDLGRKAYA